MSSLHPGLHSPHILGCLSVVLAGSLQLSAGDRKLGACQAAAVSCRKLSTAATFCLLLPHCAASVDCGEGSATWNKVQKCYDGIVSDVFLAEDARCFDSGWWAGGGDADPSISGDQDHQQGRTPAPSHMAHMDTSNMRPSWGEAKYTLCKLGDWALSCVDSWDVVLVWVLV